MVANTTTRLVYESFNRDVVVLSWPQQAGERERLEATATPRLWLVERGSEPPVATGCLDDWLRLPAEDADVRARVAALAERARHHPAVPAMDEHGQLSYRGTVVVLSPVEQQLARPLLDRFGAAVGEAELIASAWDGTGNDQTLRVHVSRLRRRLAPTGLTIASIRGYGYVLRLSA